MDKSTFASLLLSCSTNHFIPSPPVHLCCYIFYTFCTYHILVLNASATITALYLNFLWNPNCPIKIPLLKIFTRSKEKFSEKNSHLISREIYIRGEKLEFFLSGYSTLLNWMGPSRIPDFTDSNEPPFF